MAFFAQETSQVKYSFKLEEQGGVGAVNSQALRFRHFPMSDLPLKCLWKLGSSLRGGVWA